ncbi:hypothetical protein ANN_05771 [Periplaneta americana]|uniref:HTH CENPB-type domain-containing protein n=1 Tax=Periplaneta americana TaxID=6978 RepID=A0ABQ8TBQ4_PERAM|nr:hypothetical protein ANN_05771 [Periplaneta americana]
MGESVDTMDAVKIEFNHSNGICLEETEDCYDEDPLSFMKSECEDSSSIVKTENEFWWSHNEEIKVKEEDDFKAIDCTGLQINSRELPTITEEPKEMIQENREVSLPSDSVEIKLSCCKTKRTVLTLEERMKLIRESEKGISARKLAKIFKCGKTQVNTILKSKESIIREWNGNMNSGYKRKRHEKFGEVNTLVFEWFKSARSKQIPVSGQILREKALEFASQIGEEKFSASNGWLERFRLRHNIVFQSANSKVRKVPSEDWKDRLPSITSGYEARDIYIMDETGLFFRCLSQKSMALKSEQCKGGKMSKKRLTILLCANAVGEKEPPLVVGKSPTSFRSAVWAQLDQVSWHANEKAWMTSAIFEKWLSDFEKKMCKQKRKVLLFLDSAPCHAHRLKLENVTLYYLATNVTSSLHPFELGIVKEFKMHYRKRVLRYIIARIKEDVTALELAKKITVSDAVSWIISSWKQVSPKTLVVCFKSCGIFGTAVNVNVNITDSDIKDIEILAITAGVSYDPRAVETDANLDCYDDLSGNWEKHTAQEKISGGSIENSEEDEMEGTEYPIMSLQESLADMERLHKSFDFSKCQNREKIDELFILLTERLESEIIQQRCTKQHRYNQDSISKKK